MVSVRTVLFRENPLRMPSLKLLGVTVSTSMISRKFRKNCIDKSSVFPVLSTSNQNMTAGMDDMLILRGSKELNALTFTEWMPISWNVPSVAVRCDTGNDPEYVNESTA